MSSQETELALSASISGLLTPSFLRIFQRSLTPHLYWKHKSKSWACFWFIFFGPVWSHTQTQRSPQIENLRLKLCSALKGGDHLCSHAGVPSYSAAHLGATKLCDRFTLPPITFSSSWIPGVTWRVTALPSKQPILRSRPSIVRGSAGEFGGGKVEGIVEGLVRPEEVYEELAAFSAPGRPLPPQCSALSWITVHNR